MGQRITINTVADAEKKLIEVCISKLKKDYIGVTENNLLTDPIFAPFARESLKMTLKDLPDPKAVTPENKKVISCYRNGCKLLIAKITKNLGDGE